MSDDETRDALAPTPGYRYADVVGDELFVAGQVPLDSSGNVVAIGDPAAQAVASLDNLKHLLDAHAFDISEIRRVVIYVVGEHENLSTAWEGVTAWFANDVPPATLLGVNSLAYPNQLVEVDATIRRSPA